MSVYIDRTFLLRVSPKLQKFTQKKSNLYNFRCPICGDSSKNKTKARGYIYEKKNSYFFMCHNCGAGMSFYNFLDKVDPHILSEYSLEKYKNGEQKISPETAPTFDEFKVTPVFREKLALPSIQSLPDDHYAKSYILSRKIPEAFHSSLYYAEDFKKFVEVDMKIEKDGLIDNDPRIVIPFYDEEKNLIAFQGRALGNTKLRYITVKVDKDNIKLFGIDRVDLEKDKVFVLEGPIDSMFLDNAVATADSNLMSAAKHIDKTKLVLVYDNEPRNKDICKQIENAIENHFSVVIWPEMIQEKDVNEMVQNGFTPEDVQDIIERNTFVNLRAKMEFLMWKKV